MCSYWKVSIHTAQFAGFYPKQTWVFGFSQHFPTKITWVFPFSIQNNIFHHLFPVFPMVFPHGLSQSISPRRGAVALVHGFRPSHQTLLGDFAVLNTSGTPRPGHDVDLLWLFGLFNDCYRKLYPTHINYVIFGKLYEKHMIYHDIWLPLMIQYYIYYMSTMSIQWLVWRLSNFRYVNRIKNYIYIRIYDYSLVI